MECNNYDIDYSPASIDVDAGQVQYEPTSIPYVLPVATVLVLGGVKSDAENGQFTVDENGNVTVDAYTKNYIDTLQATLSALITAKYSKPASGIPSTDLAAAVRASLALANSAYQLPVSGIPSADLAAAVRASLALANSAYQLPVSGIPVADLAAAVQASLALADTALQSSDVDSAFDTHSSNPIANSVVANFAALFESTKILKFYNFNSFSITLPDTVSASHFASAFCFNSHFNSVYMICFETSPALTVLHGSRTYSLATNDNKTYTITASSKEYGITTVILTWH